MRSSAIAPDGRSIYCTKCATEVSTAAAFCPNCGSQLAWSGSAPGSEGNSQVIANVLEAHRPSVRLFALAGAAALFGWILLANKLQIAFSVFGCGQAFGAVCFAPSQLGLAVVELSGMALTIAAIVAGVIGAVKYRAK